MIKRSPPLISYLIAVRNRARNITHCLKSLSDENVDEIVVVDGNSTDGTSQLIDTFDAVHLYDQGKGPSTARNIGLKSCNGEYVVIIDGDQWISKGFDSKLKVILSTKEFDAVFCHEFWAGSSIWASARREEISQVSMLRGDSINWPRVVRRSILLAVGGWDDDFWSFEDHDLLERMKRLSPKFLKSDLIVYSDASDISPYVEFRRGKIYSRSLVKYVMRYPFKWKELFGFAPFGWIYDIPFGLKVFIGKPNIKIVLAVLILRVSRSMGRLLGLFFPTENK